MRKCGALILGVIVMLAAAMMLPAGSIEGKNEYGLFEKKLSKDQQILHALDRLTFGPRPGEVEMVQKIGLGKWLDLQLHPERIPENPELEAHLAPLATLRMSQRQIVTEYSPRLARVAAAIPLDQLQTLRQATPEQRRQMFQSLPADKRNQLVEALPALRMGKNPRQVLLSDLSQAKLFRAIYSNRQLAEELDDFWFNHFNVDIDKGADHYLTTSYERDAIRPHVLGKFRDLLEATATSPAMLFYLDNWQSVAPSAVRVMRPNAKGAKQAARGLNENYARELMELHTLGVDGGYTQQDIIEVARCFTGWTIDRPNQGGPFIYNDRVHDKGQKVVLGVIIPAGGGKEDGETVLDILARHPSTARFISKQLAQRFVADDPPPALIDRMAKTFHDSDGDIRAVLSTMFNSPQFFSAGAYRSKIKSPFEMIVSAVRASGATVDSAMALANEIANLGEPLYRKLEPTGYSSANDEWVTSSALLGRMNFGLQLAQNRLPGVQVDAQKFSTDPAEAARQLLFTNAAAQTLDSIKQATHKDNEEPPTPGLIAGLVIGSPDFQRR